MPQCIPKLMEYLIYIDIYTWTGHAAIYSEVDGIADIYTYIYLDMPQYIPKLMG